MTVVNDYLRLVQETLTQAWGQDRQPLPIQEDDWSAGIALLTKIAVETVHQSSSIEESKSSEKRRWSLPVKEESVDKITAFVQQKAHLFRAICETGFPFSLLDSASSEQTLRRGLQRYDSILFHLMNLNDSWLDERELEDRFSAFLQRLQVKEIATACLELKQAYCNRQDKRAGYYLLWLIKQSAGCLYDLPAQEAFDEKSVTQVLSQFLRDSGRHLHTTHLIEILHFSNFRGTWPIYKAFLESEPSSIFLHFTVDRLKNIPMDQWPSKAKIITDLFEELSHEHRLHVAGVLTSSKDPTTSETGIHLSAALTASSLREAISHFYALQERLPHFSYRHTEAIFARPFIQFCHDKSIYKDPLFTKRLHFTCKEEVFVYGSLMIGVSNSAERIPRHLLAYDMKSEKMVWGLPLRPNEYILKRVGERLSLHFVGEKKLSFIHPETGEVDSEIELPEVSTNRSDGLHISPEGFAYQRTYKHQAHMLIGGKIIDNQWHLSFEVKRPKGVFHPLSTHCGFQEQFENRLVLCSPTGDQVTIEGCMGARAQESKLYAIERDPLHEGQCLLTIRSLLCEAGVVSDIEESIPLNLPEAYFGKLCQNGQLILFQDFVVPTDPIFIDLLRKEVTYIPHKVPSYATYVINSHTAEVWTWDQVSKEIWKVSSAGGRLMSSMNSGRGTTFLHVDQEDRLYFVNIHF